MDTPESTKTEDSNFFDPELEGILKATSEISVTDNSTKVDNIMLKPKDRPVRQEGINMIKSEFTKNTPKVESTIIEILSRKSKIPLKSTINLQVYDKKTFKFLLDLFEQDLKQEEIIDIIINNLDMEDVRKSIKSTLEFYYGRTSK